MIPVSDLVWHRNFTYSKMDCDVALVRLAVPLMFSDSIAPIDMLQVNEEIPDGDITMVTGWGNLRVSKSSISTSTVNYITEIYLFLQMLQ